MKSLPFFFCLAAVFSLLFIGALQADDWKTTDGKTYQNVSVVKAEPDAVTITHQDGGALVPLSTLSPDLQKRFNYDPATAKTAADARTQASAQNAAALQAEINQTEAKRQAALIAEDPRNPAPTKPVASTTAARVPVLIPIAKTGTAPFNPLAEAPNNSNPRSKEATAAALASLLKGSGDANTPLSPDVLAALAALANDPSQLAAALPADPSIDPQSVNTPDTAATTSPAQVTGTPPATAPTADPTTLTTSDPMADAARGPNMHTTSDLVDITQRLKDDHPSPDHHSTASLIHTASQLGPNPNDPNHHSTDSLLNGDPLSNRQ